MTAPLGGPARRLLYVVTEDYYFVSHRLALAAAARARGFDVAVVTRVREHGAAIRAAGIRIFPLETERGGLNPFRDIATLMRLVDIYRQERPAIVHHVAMKPVLYGSVAARLTSVPRTINALAGMGWLFTSKKGLTRWLTPAVRGAMRFALAHGVALVQNPDDARLLTQLGVDDRRIRRIAGSGVDLDVFRPAPEPEGVPTVVFPARLLWDKGVGDFVSAAELLRERGVTARFVLAGERDPVNPACVSERQIAEWVARGTVERVGWVQDMPALLRGAHIVCLPSHREGLPKSLIEAAAAGRPMVTTDVPGCREVVHDGDEGFLVPAGDPSRLADAIARLIADESLRRAMGARARHRAEREFGLDAIIGQTLALYDEALS